MHSLKPLVLAHHSATDHPTHFATLRFAEGVSKRTNGQLKVTIYPDGSKGELASLLDQVIDGEIDMSIPPHDRYVKHCKKFGCVNLPFVFDNYDHADRVLDDEFMQWVKPDLHAIGLEALSCWEWGFRQFTNAKFPIMSPEDFQGLRFRVPPITANQIVMENLGANITLVEYAHMADAMRQGLADGQENPIAVIYAHKLYESQKYLSIVNYSYGSMMHIINKARFDALSPEQQRIVREESIKAGLIMRKMVRVQERQQLLDMHQLGMHIVIPKLDAFKTATAPAYQKLTELLGIEMVNHFMKMVEKNRP